MDNKQKILLLYKEKKLSKEKLVKRILLYVLYYVFRKIESNDFDATRSCFQSTFRLMLKL